MDGGLATLDEEHLGWHELLELINDLTPEERQRPGYFMDPDWSVVDVVGHVGAWLAEAHLQLERIGAGTYRPHEVDIDGINAQLLDAMRGQSWTVTWTQANAARTMLLLRWAALVEPGPDARWWIRKAGPDHYAEHLPRLREWVAELAGRRVA
jgi:hypothetical protein